MTGSNAPEYLALRWHAESMAKYRHYKKMIELKGLEKEYEEFKESLDMTHEFYLAELFYRTRIINGGE